MTAITLVFIQVWAKFGQREAAPLRPKTRMTEKKLRLRKGAETISDMRIRPGSRLETVRRPRGSALDPRQRPISNPFHLDNRLPDRFKSSTTTEEEPRRPRHMTRSPR